MRKKIIIILSLLWYHLTAWLPSAAASPAVTGNLSDTQRRAADFVTTHLTEEHGLIRSAIELAQPTNYALSESVGQILLFAAKHDENLLWDYYEPQLRKYFRQDGFYAWRVNLSDLKPDSVSALVDDLRIAAAYMERDKKQPGKYREQIAALSDGLLSHSIDSRGNIADFYAAGSGAADHVSLFYLDTSVMDKLAAYDKEWSKVSRRSREILLRMPENEFGFYPQTFYFANDKYVQGEDVSMVENLYTALFAAHIGRDTAAFAAFLRRELERGKICNRYLPTGQPSFAHDSVAVYALAAKYFAVCGDKINAELALSKMNGFYIGGGKWAGAFGYRLLGTVYAFDQLEAMLVSK